MHKTLLGILLVLAVPAACFAQDGVTDWQNLQKLKARNSIRIFKVNSPAIDGRFVRFSADAIVIDVDKVQMSIQRSDVQRVYWKKRRLFRGLIGAGMERPQDSPSWPNRTARRISTALQCHFFL